MTKKFIIASLVVATALTSCNKGTISSKRLDGSWKLSSGTGTTKNESSSTNGGTTVTSTSTSTLTWNGSTLKTVTNNTNSGVTATTTIEGKYTSEYTFANDGDTYKSVTVSDYTYENDSYLFTASDCNFSSLLLDGKTKTTVTSTITNSGLFTVLGATGEIEKNSRILTETQSSIINEVTTYAYMNGTATLGTVYTTSSSGCAQAPTTVTVNRTNSDISDTGTIITVSESTKSEMTATSKTVDTSYNGSSTTDKTVHTSEFTLKFTKQ